MSKIFQFHSEVFLTMSWLVFIFQIEYMEKKKAEGKKARDDKESVMEMLFAAFEKHQFYNLKDLVQITKQPPVSIVCHFASFGLKGKWLVVVMQCEVFFFIVSYHDHLYSSFFLSILNGGPIRNWNFAVTGQWFKVLSSDVRRCHWRLRRVPWVNRNVVT